MKTFISAAFAATLTLGSALAGGEGWAHDFEAAKKQAASENKDLLIDFTGSDWCGWCIKLNEEVFSHDEFKDGVKDKYVLVELDYPKDKSQLSEETKKQNDMLQEKYAIQGFPTIMLADAEGKPYAKTGYQPGGPESYVSHLDELQKSKAARDEAIASSADAEGVEKAKTLVTALNDLGIEDATVAAFYGDLVAQIKAADPDDETGYIKQLEAKQKFSDFETQLNEFARSQDHDGALTFINETLAKDEFEGEQKQQITLIKAMILAQKQQFDEALKILDEAKAIAPDSELGMRIDGFKQGISEARDKAAEATTEEKEDSE